MRFGPRCLPPLHLCSFREALPRKKAKTPEAPAAGPKLVSSSWTVSCCPAGETQELLCEGSQTISLAESRQTLLGVYVTPWQDEDKKDAFILRFQLPHGMNLPLGVQTKIDDKAGPSPEMQTSNQVGLFAKTDLTAPLLVALKKRDDDDRLVFLDEWK